jgi:hypothetical protein
VEELEDRLPDQMEPVLAHVRASLRQPPPVEVAPATYHEPEQEQDGAWDAEGAMAVDRDVVFDDTGEGVGVEGDLDREEDDA